MNRVGKLVERALSRIPAPPSSPSGDKVIHLALSGGVDSSVSGFLLSERGWTVRPILMRCWADDGTSSEPSCFEAELRRANAVVEALGLTNGLSIFDFVGEYWTEVFEPVTLSGFARGHTPNQDLACNRHIKFGSFVDRLKEEKGSRTAPAFATGHYAQLQAPLPCAADSSPVLMRAVDQVKDQTYFLASVRGEALRSAVFPVGCLLKSEVREIAAHCDLPSAKEQSSRGICFVGKRSMSSFLGDFLGPSRVEATKDEDAAQGEFLSVDATGQARESLGPLPHPSYCFTLGQRARIGGRARPMYVVGRIGMNVLVSEHTLKTDRMTCQSPHWISGHCPPGLRPADPGIRVACKDGSNSPPEECTLSLTDAGRLSVQFSGPRRAIAPGQALVFYAGQQVLGSALVCETTYGSQWVPETF